MPDDPDTRFSLPDSLTADLQPFSSDGIGALAEARQLLGQLTSVERPLGMGEIFDPSSAVPPEPGDRSAQQSLTPDFRVHRRSVPVLSTQNAASVPVWAAGMQSRPLGPFRDQFGRETWIDVFSRVRQVRLVRTSGASPLLQLPLTLLGRLTALPPGGKRPVPLKYDLPPGSLWFASQLLAAAAPAGAFTGLRIKGGTLTFSQPVSITGDEVIVPAAVSIDLELELEPQATPAGNGPGADARAAQVTLPEHVHLRVTSGGAELRTADSARLQVYGFQTELEALNTLPRYLPEFNRLALPFVATTSPLQVNSAESLLFTPSGSAPIEEAAWGLPVALTDAAHLGEASGNGALMLWLGTGLQGHWTGQSAPLALGPSLLTADPTRLSLLARTVTGERVQQTPQLWPGTPKNLLSLRWDQTFPVTFIAQADGSEAVFTQAEVKSSLERPLDVRGRRLPLRMLKAAVVLIDGASGPFLLIEGTPQATGEKLYGFALTNALLRTGVPNGFVLYAKYDGTRCESGVAALGFPLLGLLPTLPDPYAANYSSLRAAFDQASGTVLGVLKWTPTQTEFDFMLPPAVGLQALMQSRGEVSVLPAAPAPGLAAFSAQERVLPGAVKALGSALAFERQRGLILLDVSTNVDQFGVAFQRTAEGHPNLAIQKLTLQLDSRHLLLLTLPAVQWEPLHTPDSLDPAEPGFPERLWFANSGVPTVIGVPTANLVPIHPAGLLENLEANFRLPQPHEATARFTLPFGMIALATLRAPDLFDPRGARVRLNRPRQGVFEGAHQLQIEALDASLPADSTPSLPGFTAQLPLGQPGFRSALGSQVTVVFNSYLGHGGYQPLVPLTRLDLSGYGESLFSAWRNPYPAATAVDQAKFEVLVGRAAHEVVQVRSLLFPYAVKVIRTITIERRNNASVNRHDSGWKAVGDGTYEFPAPSDIQTHPGVVRRVTNVSHIRETGQVLTIDGIDLAAVYFDGDLELDGADSLVSTRDQLGFVQLTAGNPMPSSTYARLIEVAGALGGNLDAGLHVGRGPQGVRLHRVGVGVTPGFAGPEFVMAVWGSPTFPGGGEWSMLQLEDPNGAPQAVPRERGVPLIRAGVATAAPPLSSPYRFADPADLSHAGNPGRDYGILHATGTQRVFFPRPRIEATDPGRLVSTQNPVLADPYTLGAALGPFPELVKAVPFPSSTWALQVSAGGQYRLDLPTNPFPLGVGRRTVRQAGSVKSDLDYTGAQVTYEVDTAQPVPWRFRLDGVAKIMNTDALGDVIRLESNIAAQSGTQTVFKDPKLLLGGSLSVVQDLLTILADIGIAGIMRADMTNTWSLKVGVTVPFVDAFGEALQIPPIVPVPDIKFEDTGAKVEIKVLQMMDEASFKLAGTPMFSIKAIPGLYVAAIIQFTIKLSTSDGTTYFLLLGVGIAFSLDAGPFGFKGLFALTFFGFIGDTAIGFGIGFLLKLGLEISPIISIEISLEGRLALVWGCRGLPEETMFGAAKLTFGVEISVCLVFSISFEVETTASEVLRGPGAPACVLPDVL